MPISASGLTSWPPVPQKGGAHALGSRSAHPGRPARAPCPRPMHPRPRARDRLRCARASCRRPGLATDDRCRLALRVALAVGADQLARVERNAEKSGCLGQGERRGLIVVEPGGRGRLTLAAERDAHDVRCGASARAASASQAHFAVEWVSALAVYEPGTVSTPCRAVRRPGPAHPRRVRRPRSRVRTAWFAVVEAGVRCVEPSGRRGPRTEGAAGPAPSAPPSRRSRRPPRGCPFPCARVPVPPPRVPSISTRHPSGVRSAPPRARPSARSHPAHRGGRAGHRRCAHPAADSLDRSPGRLASPRSALSTETAPLSDPVRVSAAFRPGAARSTSMSSGRAE